MGNFVSKKGLVKLVSICSLVILGMFSIEFSWAKEAANTQSKKKVHHKTRQGVSKRSKKKTSKKAKTVGDLLSKIEKSAQIYKKHKALPEFQKLAPSSNAINLAKVKPPHTAQLFYDEGTDERELEKVTDEGIQQLYELIQKFKTSSKRGELWLRLAELYVEKARLIEFRLQNEFDKKLDLYAAKKLKHKPRLDLSSSMAYNKKAIQLYEWFVRDYSKDPKMDQALFFLGYNYFELGDSKKGQYYYKKLSREYPQSTYRTETDFSLGEFYFERSQWKDAGKYYSQVAKRKKGRLYSFAEYKLSWCYYKLGKYKSAIQSLEQVIYAGRRAKTEGKNNHSLRLAQEALKDIVPFYAEVYPYEKAYSYFEKAAGIKSAPKLYEKLAYYYSDKGNRKAARFIFLDLIARNPYAPRAFEYQYKVVQMYSAAGNDKIFREELFRWIENYGEGSTWYNENKKDKSLTDKSSQLAEAALRNYTLQLHQNAQNSHAKYSQEMASKGYELYLQVFKNSSRATEMHFFYAELLYDRKLYKKAAENYNWVVKNDPKGPYYEVSILNALLSLEKQLPSPEDIRKIVGNAKEEIPFDESIKNFIFSANKYIEQFPNGKNILEIKYKMATLYYYYNHFHDAKPLFAWVIKKYPKTKYAEYSANLLLDIYNINQDYAGLEKTASNILKVPGMNSSQVGMQIQEIKQRSAFKQAEQLQSSGKVDDAANEYKSFAMANKQSPLAGSAAYNAAINYEKAGHLIEALSMYNLTLSLAGKSESTSKGKRHSKALKGSNSNNKIIKDSRRFSAEIYQKLGDYRSAAYAFEKYANEYPSDKISIEFIYNAAVIREGLSHINKALGLYSTYLSQSKSKDRYEVYWNMAQLWEKKGSLKKSVEFYEKYLNSSLVNKVRAVEASYKLAHLYEKLNNTRQSQKYYNTTIRLYKQKSRAYDAPFAAESRFHIVYSTYEELIRIKIPKNSKKQSVAVQQKLSIVERLKEQLKSVVAYNDPVYITAALTLQGSALRHLALAISSAPIPKGYTKEQEAQYRSEISKITNPLIQQAIQSYTTAIEKGHQLRGYSSWLIRAMNERSQLDVKGFPPFDYYVFPMQINQISLKDINNKEMVGAFEANQHSEFLDQVAKGLEKNPQDPEALGLLAYFHFRQHEIKMSEIILERMADAKIKNSLTLNLMALIESQRSHLNLAIGFYKESVELNPNNFLAKANLSSLDVNYRNFGSAVGPLEDVYNNVKSNLGRNLGDEEKISMNYAVCLGEMDKGPEAEKIYETIIDKGLQNVYLFSNYARLLIEEVNKPEAAKKWISKARFISRDKKVQLLLQQLEDKIKK